MKGEMWLGREVSLDMRIYPPGNKVQIDKERVEVIH
jgi:hypothetical protein